MSADNWGECPKCGEGIRRMYRPTPFREDYEIGIYKGKFFIDYRGHCQSCNYLKEFKHNEEIGGDT